VGEGKCNKSNFIVDVSLRSPKKKAGKKPHVSSRLALGSWLGGGGRDMA
jgi:hypothetical protein